MTIDTDGVVTVVPSYNDDEICTLLRENDPRLERLALKESRIVHCCPNFQEFLDSIRCNSSIRSVYVGELIVQMSSEDQLNQLLCAIGQITTLEALEVTLPHILENKRITGQALLHLMRAPNNLKTLILWPFVQIATMEEFDAISDSLRDHPSLQQLAWMHFLLPPMHLGDVNCDNLFESLATIPNLETVQISAGFRPMLQRDRRHPIGEEALCNLIQSSPKLKHLSLRNFGMTDSHCERLCQTLISNENIGIKLLDLRFNNFTTDGGYQQLKDMLVKNYTLEWLESDLDDQQVIEEICFLLLLNRAGRYTLLQDPNATKQECVNVFARTENNLDATYFLIRNYPSICQQFTDDDDDDNNNNNNKYNNSSSS